MSQNIRIVSKTKTGPNYFPSIESALQYQSPTNSSCRSLFQLESDGQNRLIYVEFGEYTINTPIQITKSNISIIGIPDSSGKFPIVDFSQPVVSWEQVQDTGILGRIRNKSIFVYKCTVPANNV